MLTNFRSDYIPFYANPRHMKQIHHEVYKTKNMFRDK